MSKNFFFKFGFMLVFVAVALLWVLSVAMPEEFGAFTGQWAIVIACGLIGIFYVFRAFAKNLNAYKKFYLLVGFVLIAIAVVMLINIFSIKNDLIVPIIALLGAIALLLSVVVTGGKKWDQGDNKNMGYKNYFQRKAEEEKNKNKENK